MQLHYVPTISHMQVSACIRRSDIKKKHPDAGYDEVMTKILAEFGCSASRTGKLYFNKGLVSRDAFSTMEKCLSSRKCTIKAATFMMELLTCGGWLGILLLGIY